MNPASIPWYKSNVLRWLLVAAVTHILNKLGAADQIPAADIASFVEGLLELAEPFALAGAAYARAKLANPPVTLRKETP